LDLHQHESGADQESGPGFHFWTPGMYDYQNLVGTSLFKDTSVVNFMKIQSVVFMWSCYQTNRKTDRPTNAGQNV